MKASAEHHFTGPTQPLTGIYSSNVTGISTLIFQSTGPTELDKYISPRPAAMINFPEVALSSRTSFMPFVHQWSSNIFWVFTATNAAAAATREFYLTEYDSNANTLTYKGFITLSGTFISGSKTVTSLRVFVTQHTTGTVSTSGPSSTINGSGTGFVNERIAVGARIGFGTTDPTAVTAWYEIIGITNNTALTITGTVNLAGSTPYVIEEIRIATTVTNATILNGGIHLIKGLNYSTFTVSGTTIPEFALTDNIRASYLLRDQIGTLGVGVTNITYSGTANIWRLINHGLNIGDVIIFTSSGTLPAGVTASTRYYVVSSNIGIDSFSVSASLNGAILTFSAAGTGIHTVHSATNIDSATLAIDNTGLAATNQTLYLLNRSAVSVVSASRYNLRAPLLTFSHRGIATVGVSTGAFLYSTSALPVTGTVSQLNCGRIAEARHGVASGVPSFYFTATTRIYRAPVKYLTPGSTNWIDDSMIEVPPGGSTTFSQLGALGQIDYSSAIDRFLITNTVTRFGTYVTPYVTGGEQFEKYAGTNLNRLKLTSSSSGASDGLFPQATLTIWTEGGYLFAMPNSVVSGQNWLLVFPGGADAFYNSNSNQHAITPKIATIGATKFYHVYVDHMDYAGDYGTGFPVESYRIWYRTTGIDDNTGEWIEVPLKSNLESATPNDYIQFKIAFEILGEICVPTRIYSIAVTYENTVQDFHYQPSLLQSSAASRIFAWQQIEKWDSNIPDLRIRLYDANTNVELLNDTVLLSDLGVWEYSDDGGSNWNVWDDTQDLVGNYIRYSAQTWSYSGVTVRVLLTEA